jgi:2-dehydro-3-deoxyphosphogluconate aldolase/(4S)-4-hydroxy-2-oxoglutarate aldolase
VHSINDWFDTAFGEAPIMAILRGFSVARTVELAERAWSLGIECVEVPIQSAAALDALSATVAAGQGRGKAVGAGTVVSAALVTAAAQAGARFTVGPGYDPAVVEASRQAGLAHLPGVATATEVHRAHAQGVRWVKVFPARSLGPEWFSVMHGPFPQMEFVATGGVDASNAGMFLDAGARVVGVGSALTDDVALHQLVELVAARVPQLGPLST